MSRCNLKFPDREFKKEDDKTASLTGNLKRRVIKPLASQGI